MALVSRILTAALVDIVVWYVIIGDDILHSG